MAAGFPDYTQDFLWYGLRRFGMWLFRATASLRLAVVLIVTLAAVLAVATVLESARGREYAQWYVYRSHWFIGLLGLLGLNILAATLIRFPWGIGRIGFVMTHTGLLVLLAGAVQTFTRGVEGTLAFQEGESANAATLSERSQLTVIRPSQMGGHAGGFHGSDSVVFAFRPGPVDWPEGKTLDLGYLGGVGVRVLKYYRHAEVEEQWLADPAEAGGPAVRFALRSARAPIEGHPPLFDEESGEGSGIAAWLSEEMGPLGFGPARFEIHRAPVASLVEDFLRPPSQEKEKESDSAGVLSMHYQGRMTRVPVGPNVGRKLPLGDTGLSVEIAEYLPNARLVGTAKFASDDKRPDNPLLELRVHVPGQEKPIRQIAFARRPFLTLDAVHGWDCPVKFWYHHPAVKAVPGVEFLAVPGGKLYCRVGSRDQYISGREVRPGDEIDTGAHFQLRVLEYLPSARREVVFRPAAPSIPAGDETAPTAAALVEVDVEGTIEQVWVKQNDATYGMRRLDTAAGPLLISFGYERLPLDFTLKLLEFQRGTNPGGMGDASFASRVRLVDRAAGVNDEFTISMNQPLVHRKYVFYQSSFQEQAGGDVSILTVAYDPGRTLKYLGSLLTCLGILVMICKRVTLGRRGGRVAGERPARPSAESRPAAQAVAGVGAEAAAPGHGSLAGSR